METRSAKRKKFWFEGESRVDRITDLPDVIIHHILFFLPIKTIAKTSVLSKRWRSLWISLPDLDFTSIGDSSTDIEPRNDERSSLPCNSLSSYKRMDFISQVLDLRNKHSDLRVLRFCAPLSFSHLNGLIRRAIKQNVQELEVEVATHDYFNFPRSVLTSESLRVFKLRSRYPGFRLPPSIILKGGFRSLQSLSLSLVILHNQRRLSDLFTDSSFPRLKMLNLNAFSGLEHLKVSCLALEELTVENCYQLLALDVSGAKLKKLRVAACFTAFFYKSWVKINAPSLRTLDWECNGINRTSSLENLTSLKEASIGFNVVTGDESLSELQSVSSLLSALSQINCLTLANLGFEILSNKKYVSNVMLSFNNLKSLEIVTGFNKHNVAGLAHLFKSSPTLHTLILRIIYDHKIDRTKWNKDLWAMPTTEEQFWESQTQTFNSFLNHLCVVKIYGFLEYVNEVSLAKFLLKHGKALQEMIISPGHCNYRDSLRRQKFRSQMMGFSRASSKAKIDFV